MEVHVTLTRDDLFAYQMHCLRRSRVFGRQILKRQIVHLILALGVSILVVPIFHAAGLIQTGVGMVLCFVLLMAMYSFLIVVVKRRMLKRYLRRVVDEGDDRALLSPQTFTLTEDRIRFEGELSGGWAKWEAIEEVVETDDHIFIFLGQRRAHIIPKRAFSSASEAAEFADTARRYKANAPGLA